MRNGFARRTLLGACLAAGLALLAFPAAASAGTLSSSPPSSTFNDQPWFFGGQFNSFQITNSGTDTAFGSAFITGPDQGRFSINGDFCNGGTFGDNQTCNVGVNFNPPNGPGTFSAQLEIPSDGSPNPLVIPLSAEALAGPAFVASPSQLVFAATTIGAARSLSVAITNTGDFPGGVQQAFVVGPPAFDIEDDQCSQQELDPGESCILTALFAPSAARDYEGSLFAIIGTPTAPVLNDRCQRQGPPCPRAGTRDDDHAEAEEQHQQGGRLSVHLAQSGRELRVQARQGTVRTLHVAVDVRRQARQAHLPGSRH